MKIFASLVHFFDKLEDKVRGLLSRFPIIYASFGAVGIVLLWRGIWMWADQFEFLTGPVSIIIAVIILLMTGLFASFFVGDVIILSGLKKEKKMIEKTETEVFSEEETLSKIKKELDEIREKLDYKK